jgi:hypothetical protein
MSSEVWLSPLEIHRLRLMCANPFLELGATMRPEHLKCFEPHVITKTLNLVITFPDNAAAIKWNKMHEARIRKRGHQATIALTVALALILGGAARAVTIPTGAAASILKDEVQARIWYPRMCKEWTLEQNFHFRFQQFPRKSFHMEWTDVIKDEYGKVAERRMHDSYKIEVGEPGGIPEQMVREIMTRHSPDYTRVFE